MKRREFLKRSAGLAGGVIAASQLKSLAQAQAEKAASSGGALVIDPKPLFEISPHLYMQFMEPLGVTDSSVEAAWDYNRDDWRRDFVDTTRDLAPGMLRFGGLLSRYSGGRKASGRWTRGRGIAITSGAARRRIASGRTSSWTFAGASMPSRCIA